MFGKFFKVYKFKKKRTNLVDSWPRFRHLKQNIFFEIFYGNFQLPYSPLFMDPSLLISMLSWSGSAEAGTLIDASEGSNSLELKKEYMDLRGHQRCRKRVRHMHTSHRQRKRQSENALRRPFLSQKKDLKNFKKKRWKFKKWKFATKYFFYFSIWKILWKQSGNF